MPGLKRLKHEDHEFEASLGNTVRSCLQMMMMMIIIIIYNNNNDEIS
jgi:hypothetical protein